MGAFPGKRCYTNTEITTAPNPDPSRWILVKWVSFNNACVVKVKYKDCTNFEGNKVLVFEGPFEGLPEYLDPHFSEDNESPIARFKPTAEGWNLACEVAKLYN